MLTRLKESEPMKLDESNVDLCLDERANTIKIMEAVDIELARFGLKIIYHETFSDKVAFSFKKKSSRGEA